MHICIYIYTYLMHLCVVKGADVGGAEATPDVLSVRPVFGGVLEHRLDSQVHLRQGEIPINGLQRGYIIVRGSSYRSLFCLY